MRTFWGHFGSILVALWRPFGSLWVPLGHRWFHLSSLLHLGGTLFAPCAPCWWPLGSFSFPSGILAAFWMDFVAFSKEFKRIFPCLAVTGGIPSFFFNDFKRAERASERSEPRAKLFVESATRGSHCIFLPRMARQTFQIIDVNPCSREGLLLTRFPFPC